MLLTAQAAAAARPGGGSHPKPSFKVKMPGSSASNQVLIMKKRSGKASALGADASQGPQVVQLEPSETVDAAIERLQARDDVEWAQRDLFLVPTAMPNDPSYSQQWGLPDIGAPAAWDLSTGGPLASLSGGTSPATVCVIDSGVETTHPDLAGSLHPDVGYNAFDPTQPITDSLGHGTHIAGVIAAAGNNGVGVSGVSWGTGGVQVLVCKFIGPQGYGTTSAAIACLQYCTSKGAQIISASWTGGTDENPALRLAFQAAGDAGALLVVAAGNDGYDLSRTPTYPAAYSKTMPFVLTVGASDQNEAWPNFSNYDPATVHLSAPGVNILSTVPGAQYAFYTGTSMATPFVSGAAGLVLAATGGTLTAAQLKSVLINGASPAAGLAGRSATGGVLRVDKALQAAAALLGQAVPVPVFSPPQPSPSVATSGPNPKQHGNSGSGASTGGSGGVTAAPSSPQAQYRAITTTVPCKKGSKGCWRKCWVVRVKGRKQRKCSWVRTVQRKVKTRRGA